MSYLVKPAAKSSGTWSGRTLIFLGKGSESQRHTTTTPKHVQSRGGGGGGGDNNGNNNKSWFLGCQPHSHPSRVYLENNFFKKRTGIPAFVVEKFYHIVSFQPGEHILPADQPCNGNHHQEGEKRA